MTTRIPVIAIDAIAPRSAACATSLIRIGIATPEQARGIGVRHVAFQPVRIPAHLPQSHEERDD